MFPRYSTSLYVVVLYTVIHVVTAKDFLKAQSELRLKSFDKTINTNVIKFLFKAKGSTFTTEQNTF